MSLVAAAFLASTSPADHAAAQQPNFRSRPSAPQLETPPTVPPAAQPESGSQSASVSAQTVTAYRLPPAGSRSGGKYTGSTLLDLGPDLSAIARGQEPRTLQQLRALEQQQIAVSERIAAVTVNILQGSAQGSGVIVSPDGFILTAAHVAGRPGREAKITLADGRQVRGKTLGMNRSVDAGLVQIVDESINGWPHASIGVSDDLKQGQWVIAAGHPGGLDDQRPPVIRIGRLLDLMPSTLVTDCALIGGDSGGPLFDLSGKLIGIHSRIGTHVAENMHVPIDMYRAGWERMARSESWGTLPGYKPVIGVRGFVEGPKASTAAIESVIEDGPADQAGIRAGDVITRFDGVDVQTFEELIRAVESVVPGDRVRVSLMRDGEPLEKRLIVGIEDP